MSFWSYNIKYKFKNMLNVRKRGEERLFDFDKFLDGMSVLVEGTPIP